MSQQNVTMEGEPVTLVGQSVNEGDPAPSFTAVNNELETIEFSPTERAPAVISSVVSLDTPVCDQQARRFNEEAAHLSETLGIYVLSMDLPFAQERWCGAAGIEQVTTLSDYRDASFGKSYGLLIGDLQLLARAVFVLDSEGIVRYKEVVEEVTDHPDYQKLFEAVQTITAG